MLDSKQIKVIAFDADDTLWVNEPFFREGEEKFAILMENYLPRHSSLRELLAIEIENLDYYGYGIKAFVLSMIETALKISNHTIPLSAIDQIVAIGKEMMMKPVEILDGVKHVLETLNGTYRLVMATKGDLLDQERKLEKSGLADHFHHIEIVSEKKEPNYEKLIKHLDVSPDQFLMIGNSLKSDVLPVLNIGGYGFHVPYHITWEHERVEAQVDHPKFRQLENITDVLNHLQVN